MSITTTPVEQNGTGNAAPASLPAVFGERPWRKSIPAKVRKGAITSADSPAWQAWRDVVSARRSTPAIDKRAATSPVRWGLESLLSADDLSSVDWALLDSIHVYACAKPATPPKAKTKRKTGSKRSPRPFAADQLVRAWLSESEGAPVTLGLAAELLAWTYALPKLAQDLPAELWWELLAHLVATVRDAQQQDPQASPAVYQMLAAEAAIALGLFADELRACREVSKAGGSALIAAFDQLLDGEGTPQRDYIAALRPFAASWLRCHRLLQENDSAGSKQVRKAFKQFPEVILAVARFTRPDRSAHFSSQPPSAKSASSQQKLAEADQWLLQLAAADKGAGNALQVALGTAARESAAERADSAYEVECSAEWSELAVLRSSWRQFSPRLLVDYGTHDLGVELAAGRHSLLAGALKTEISIDGERLQTPVSWNCVCWQTDTDGDYLELEGHPAPGILLQRSILLAHEDCFLWMADSLASGRKHELDYRLTLPAASGLTCKLAGEHTEAELATKKKSVARVMPLSLPEWSSAARDGKLSAEDGNLVLQQRQQGWGMYAGLFIDLQPSRLARQFTWRQLTVAENREILPSDLAVAQRVQCGSKHWVFYRSIGARGNRTFLGINVSTELLVARFETDGEYETLVEVL